MAYKNPTKPIQKFGTKLDNIPESKKEKELAYREVYAIANRLPFFIEELVDLFINKGILRKEELSDNFRGNLFRLSILKKTIEE